MHRCAMAMLALAASLALTGCVEELESDDAVAAPAETTPAAGSSGGGRSSLGKAKETAENTASEVERRNQDLIKQIEGD